MRTLRERLKTPIMADESVSDFHSAGVVIREQACDSVKYQSRQGGRTDDGKEDCGVSGSRRSFGDGRK